MSDRYTTSTTESWGSRLMGSIKGVLFGFVLFFYHLLCYGGMKGEQLKLMMA